MIEIEAADFNRAKFKNEIDFCQILKKHGNPEIKTIIDGFLVHIIFNMLIYVFVSHLKKTSNANDLLAQSEKAVDEFIKNNLTQ